MLWTSFILGLIGSLHCAGMCGPLALAVPVAGNGSRSAAIFSRLVYNSGRILTYCIFGLVAGLVGRSVVLAGLQRWLSIGLGVTILLFLLSKKRSLNLSLVSFVTQLKGHFSNLLRRRGFSALLLLGLLNGFLPCGLVYAASAGAATTAGPIAGAASMLSFGLGTLPMMLTVAFTGPRLQASLRFRFQSLVPAATLLLGILLILRGLSLGIPYVSPNLSGGPPCH
jgi:uncharacterized protein